MDATVLTQMVITGVIAIGIGIAGYIASMIAVRLVRPLAARFLEPGLANFAVSLTRVAVLLLALKLIVDQTGAAGVLVILVTAITGAFALGSERIASDVVAGINLFMLRYYRVNDLVTIGDHHGRVNSISLTHTSLSNKDRDKIIIPNSEVLGQVIVNHTGIPGARLTANVQIEGQHDRDVMIRMLLEAAALHEPQLRGPNDAPSVALTGIDKSYGSNLSTYTVRVIVPEESYGDNPKLFLHLIRALETHGVATRLPTTA